MQRSISALLSIAFAVAAPAGDARAAGEKVIYRFQGGSDGAQPMASMLADKAGTLYGATNLGGSGSCTNGCGSIFALSPPVGSGGVWTETQLHSFQGGNDGANPEAPLIADAAGNLFGTTSQGGTGNCGNEGSTGCGIVFELSPSQGGQWTETILYSFQGNPGGKGNGDLAWPNGIVFGRNGKLYGLAYDGGHCITDETGTSCYGGAFELKNENGAWKERVLYRFDGASGSPDGPIFDARGNLYGTAPGGAYGCGGVFELSPPQTGGKWTETSVYDFRCGSDGAFPLSGLVFDAKGNLYDTSIGAYSNPSNIFELMPAKGGGWTESTLYNFSPPANGYEPSVGPTLDKNGNIYGTTEGGGKNLIGVVFALVPHNGGWTETVLHSFAGGVDGAAPYGGLVVGKGKALYGTTLSGGGGSCTGGCGIVFKIMP